MAAKAAPGAATHAAFLRGINVTGRRVGGETLRNCLEEIGLGAVATFRASGNVVFAADRGGARELAERIEEALEAELGYPVPTFIRSAAQVRAIAAHEPFPSARIEASKGKLQVALLPKKPGKKARERTLEMATDRDALAIEGSELFWLPSGGTMESELDQKALGRLLGPWTMRTAGTIGQMSSKFFAG